MSTAQSTLPHIYPATTLATLATREPALTLSVLEGLRRHSIAAKSQAYCPYSHFRVGATLATVDGAFIDGANIENAAYPSGLCAERVALAAAVCMHREAKRRFIAMAIATDGNTPVSPCGMCRQFMREFCPLDMPVLMFDRDGNFMVLALDQVRRQLWVELHGYGIL